MHLSGTMPVEAEGGKLGTGAHMGRVLEIRRRRSEAQESLKTLRAELKKVTGGWVAWVAPGLYEVQTAGCACLPSHGYHATLTIRRGAT